MTRILATFVALVWVASSASAEVGDDGLHKADWLHETFLDLRDDLAEANAEGKRLVVLIEQRGCIYCEKMHEEIFPIPLIEKMLTEDYFAIRLNLYGSVEVTDFDGTAMSEKAMARRWGVFFTPTLLFFPEEVPEGLTAQQAAVALMPGAFEYDTMRDMLTWVLEKGYLGDEGFQRYHSRMIEEKGVEPDPGGATHN